MSTFEQQVEAAVAPGPDRVAAGVTLMCATKQGVVYNRTFGSLSIKSDSPPLLPDNVAAMASCTKLITSIAALQCVERGLLTLDGDVAEIYPPIKDVKIFKGYSDESDDNVMEDLTEVITLRKLLTHTSGFAYPFMALPDLVRYYTDQKKHPMEIMGDIDKMCSLLVFQPGEEGKWCYGTGIDMAGRLVEIVNGGMKLGDYYERNIFAPLGVKDLCFRFDGKEDLLPRLMPEALRRSDGKLHFVPPKELDPKDDCGGSGIFGTAPEYFKILMAVFNNDSRLLKAESWRTIYDPQVYSSTEVATEPMTIDMCIRQFSSNAPVPEESQEFDWAHGLICSIFQSDVPGWMRKNTLHWGGLRNSTWFIDHESEIVTFLFTNILPFEDPPIVRIKSLFHSEMLKRFAVDGNGKAGGKQKL